MSVKNLVFGIVLGIALAAGIWLALGAFRIAPEPGPENATVLPVQIDMPAFSLMDQHGNAIDEDVFRGQWDLVFFGFTRCPDVCPLTLGTLGAAIRQLRAAGHTPLPRIVLVSVDPERDTPASLSAYVSSFGADSLGITGDLGQIHSLTDPIGIYFEKRDQGSGDYTVDHSAVVLLVDPDGRLVALFSSPHKVENFVRDLPLLTRS